MLLNKTTKAILSELAREKNTRIYGRELAKKHKLNQKTVANTLKKLEQEDILKYKVEGKNKYYFLNEFNTLIKEVIQIIEIEKKADFIKSHKSLNGLFRQIESKCKGVIVLFGSYAKGTENKESDIDLLVFEKANLTDIEKSFGKKLNTVRTSKEKFDKNSPFVREVLKNHIILKGVEEFVNLAW